MNSHKDIKIEDYTYELPFNRIAKYPLPQRDNSKLLVYKNQSISDSLFSNIAHEIPEQSLIITNNSKVIPARLFFQKDTGATIEIFCLEPYNPADYQISFATKHECTWKCIVGNKKKWKEQSIKKIFPFKDSFGSITANKLETNRQETIIKFSWDIDICFSEILEIIGLLPIPPYLGRETEKSDYEKYQTIFSINEGSVAAPTAGLHFTESVLQSLKEKKNSIANITLHVGAGTFKPVKSETIGGHSMHGEYFSVSKETIEKLCLDKNIIAVGTTSARTLESLYWLGLLISKNQCINNDVFEIKQWLPYEIAGDISKGESFNTILRYLESNNIETLHCKTSIILVPGYKFRVINQLITNFHQPNSTLLLLIAAFVGDGWRNIYNYALENDYRFLSYGDSSLLFGK